MSSYLLNRNGNYHVRIRIPSDLTGILAATELVKSLRTRDLKTARVAALPYRQTITKTFSLLRSGFITNEQALNSIDRALNRKSKATPNLFPAIATERNPDPPPADFVPLPCPVSPPPPKFQLSTTIHQYLTDRQRGWGPKTKMENEGSYRLMLDILGDREVDSIDRVLVRGLRDKLMLLPANLYKLFPNRSASQILEIIPELPASGFSPMSITTVNKHVSRFSSLMKHCMKEGYIQSNPAVGLKIKQKRRPDEERKAYSSEDLRNILINLPQKEDKPERYWIPIIGMLSGLRLDEACQLYTEDVKQIEGIWCLDINSEHDKKLKPFPVKDLFLFITRLSI